MDIGQLICTPFAAIVSAVNSWTGSYLLALLAFTVVMKVVFFPLSIKQQKNSVRQAKLRPREEAIRAKYAGRNDKRTQQKMQQEVMEMYQEEKFSPLSGCLPLLIQLPLLLILYSIVRQPLMYTASYSADEVNALKLSMAFTEHYDARAEMEGAVGGEFRLEYNKKDGTYVFYDPLTGKDCLVKEETVNNQSLLLFYPETKDGSFSVDSVSFLKSSIHEYAPKGTATDEAIVGLPSYPVGASGAPMEESAMVSYLQKNVEKTESAYAEIFKARVGLSTVEELNLAGRLPNLELFDGAIDLGATPNFTQMNWLLIIPVLTFITSFVSQWLTRKFTYQPQGAAETQSSMRMMNVMMPLLSVWISFSVPAALAVYWIMQNLISPLQQIILAKCWPVPKYSEDELKKLKNEYVARQKGRVDKKSIPAPKRRSLVYDDDEDEAEEVAPEEERAPEEEGTEKSDKQKKSKKQKDTDSPIGKADLK